MKLVKVIMAAAFIWSGLFINSGAQILEPEFVDRIVAVVNNDIITLFELRQTIKPLAERLKSMGHPARQEKIMLEKIRKDILNQLIETKLSEQESKKAGISVRKEEIDNYIKRMQTTNNLTDEQFSKALATDGMSIEEYRRHLESQILRAKLVNLKVKSKIVVTNDEVKKYYNQHSEEYGGGSKYQLFTIIKKIPSPTDQAAKQNIRTTMEQALAKLKNNVPFEAVVREYSDALVEEGGKLGLFHLGDLSPLLKTAVMNLKQGEFTDIIETDMGYQIIFLGEIITSTDKALEDARTEIEEKLFYKSVDRKYKDWVSQLRDQSHIKIIY